MTNIRNINIERFIWRYRCFPFVQSVKDFISTKWNYSKNCLYCISLSDHLVQDFGRISEMVIMKEYIDNIFVSCLFNRLSTKCQVNGFNVNKINKCQENVKSLYCLYFISGSYHTDSRFWKNLWNDSLETLEMEKTGIRKEMEKRNRKCQEN